MQPRAKLGGQSQLLSLLALLLLRNRVLAVACTCAEEATSAAQSAKAWTPDGIAVLVYQSLLRLTTSSSVLPITCDLRCVASMAVSRTGIVVGAPTKDPARDSDELSANTALVRQAPNHSFRIRATPLSCLPHPLL